MSKAAVTKGNSMDSAAIINTQYFWVALRSQMIFSLAHARVHRIRQRRAEMSVAVRRPPCGPGGPPHKTPTLDEEKKRRETPSQRTALPHKDARSPYMMLVIE